MDIELKKSEEQLEAHLSAIVVMTLLFIALIGETILMHWESWAIIYIAAATVFIWFCHLTYIIPMNVRKIIYVIVCMGTFFFYSIHETSFFDTPIICMIMLFVFLTLESEIAIYGGALLYVFVLFWQLVIMKKTTLLTGPLEISRLFIDIFSISIVTFFMRNVSYRKKKNSESIEKAVAELKEMNRQTESFMASVSHELRTPINAVMGITESILRKENDETKRKQLIPIKKAGLRLFYQISNILDYSEIGMKRLKVSEIPYSIVSTVTDVMSDLREMNEEEKKEVELILDIDLQTPALMTGDEIKIKKILRHLIENALKFTKEGCVYTKVRTLKEDYGVNLNITICDTGLGMSEEQLSKVQGRLYQEDSKGTGKGSGIGLGLTVISGLVRSMGGFIRFESSEGKGTKVFISIPQKVSDSTPCMTITEKKPLVIAYYFLTQKFSNPIIRDYYEKMITTIQKSLKGTLIRVSDLKNLESIIRQYHLTHIFTTEYEYEDGKEFFSSLPAEIHQAVIVSKNFDGHLPPSVSVIRKPLSSIPLIQVLNEEYDPEQIEESQHFICPAVKALVVDDDEMNLMVADGFLRDYKMSVTLATSGKEAIELCKRQNFDIIFLDHMMPEMDGIECLHQLRKLKQHSSQDLIIVAFTANAVSGARDLFLAEGFNEFIAKPIEARSFERVLKRVLPPSLIQFLYGSGQNYEWEDESVTEATFPAEDFMEDDFSESGDAGAENDDGRYERLLQKLQDALDCLEEDRAERLLRELDGIQYKGMTAEELLPGSLSAIKDFDFSTVRKQVAQLLENGGNQ